VEPEHLADPRRFDFAGLEGRRLAEMTEAEEAQLETRLESSHALRATVLPVEATGEA
jgi:hypothetical protein